MVVTRNSGLSENFRASKKILRDIKSCKSLRPRVSNPNYREESPEDGSYAFFHKILKVDVNNKKSVSHKLKFQSSNRKKTFKEIHRFKLRTSENNQVENDTKDNTNPEYMNNKIAQKSEDSVKIDLTKSSKDAPNNSIISEERPVQKIVTDTPKLDSTNKESQKYIFNSNNNKRAFKRRISGSFSRIPEHDDSGRRYPSRMRRQPTDMYRVNCTYTNSDKKANWQNSMSSPIQNMFPDPTRHRKLEFHSKRLDSDDSDDLLEDEIRFEKRKKQSVLRARSELNPINLSTNAIKMDLLNERNLARSSLADIEPMNIDHSITFSMVGGNTKYIEALKESVILPLMYPEVFRKLSISPPRGLLFYGPPGSGKTLLARALVNECSRNSNCKLAFFMRKGADCLSKWVGESERQLRLLFDQAYRMRPSIIFFDEIDGLAPVRSVKQDQIHSSIVSTLLSLIDGLDNRGEIIIIGATNRLDAIDPALRRPGRFDREFMFTLPEEHERRDIIRIHTRDWRPPLSDQMVSNIAAVTKGFSGADIKALVVEAGLCALRRRYPQIYSHPNKLQLDLGQIFIKEEDFRLAITIIRPSNERNAFPVYSHMPVRIKKLLYDDFNKLTCRVAKFFQEPVFPETDSQSSQVIPGGRQCFPLFKWRLLVTGFAVDQLVSSVFNDIVNVNVLSFDSVYLGLNNGLSPEEKLCHLFREADKCPRSIIFLPHIDVTFNSLSLSGQHLLLQLVQSHNPHPELTMRTVLILATLSLEQKCWSAAYWQRSGGDFDSLGPDANDFSSPMSPHHVSPCSHQTIWAELGHLFHAILVHSPNHAGVHIEQPGLSQRREYFAELVESALAPVERSSAEASACPGESRDEMLEEVQMTPRVLDEHELQKLELEEDNVLRKFRILLRMILAKLAKERKFQVFLNPVDVEEVPDYYSIISNPIDLSTMRHKVDLYNYNTFEEFKNDLHLITANALLYNPPTNSYLKDIRRHAYEFNDIAESVFEDHWNPEFEKTVKDIHESRLKRKYYDKIRKVVNNQSEKVREYLVDLNGSKLDIANGPLLRTQLALYNKFYKLDESELVASKQQRHPQSDNELQINKKSSNPDRLFKKTKSVSDVESINLNETTLESTLQSFKEQHHSESLAHASSADVMESRPLVLEEDCASDSPGAAAAAEQIIINQDYLDELVEDVAKISANWPIIKLEEVYFKLSRTIASFASSADRSQLPSYLWSVLSEYYSALSESL